MLTREHVETAQEFLEKSDRYFIEGDLLQCSEKTWGAAAHVIMAVAQQRGWNHRYHNHLRAVASCMSMEWGRPDWETSFGALDSLHTSTYEHQWLPGELRSYLEPARSYCRELADARQAPPPQDVQLTPEQQATQDILLRTLTRPLSEQAAFGEQFTVEEEAELPPVSPTQP